jgi:DNA-binding XRE family transcriptional regulator
MRKNIKLDQSTLASKLNVSPKTVSHWETGYTEPSITQLIIIADFFDTTIDELVDRK